MEVLEAIGADACVYSMPSGALRNRKGADRNSFPGSFPRNIPCIILAVGPIPSAVLQSLIQSGQEPRRADAHRHIYVRS